MKTNNKGFTLIEMLVVVAIVGLLSAVVVVGLTGAREKARDSRRVADLREIQNQLELDYASDTGYPANIQGFLGAASGEVPEDPQAQPYQYATTNNGFSYELGACVEDMANISAQSATCSNITCSQGTLFCVTPE